ncbi:hypothetical protein K2173_020397 [Erythroxylum novogranatense]|uniref:Poly(A) RNA polymerase mitochondrial-like central palm domain-containing protein n=1 Tax=Erythroxylum novogranatense TaxID=1862640 RepID=A0AAV8TG61_9ROSI|nr:hypothetical protein K2173_020397 [Erythroxylum novogranatense]
MPYPRSYNGTATKPLYHGCSLARKTLARKNLKGYLLPGLHNVNKMNVDQVLEPTLKAILDAIQPLSDDWRVRSEIIQELQDVVRSVESLRGATVEPFGSFVSNLFTRWGDLDISVTLSNRSCISSAGKKCKQKLLGELLRALRQKGGWHRLQFIPNARVPILTSESAHQNISCDISIDNLHGHIKSKLLFWINEIDGRFRQMILLVKEWAKTHNINNPKAGTFNSYSLSLLVIFHFQTCAPAILPPLQALYPRSATNDLIGLRADAERNIAEICASNIMEYRSSKYRAINRSSLSGLFLSFLAKFSDIHLKSKELGICPFTGQWEDVKSNMRWLPRTYSLFIEDPFEQPENTARAVSAGNLIKISEAFRTTYQQLATANQTRISILGTLVRPHISHFIAGIPVGNRSYPNVQHGSTCPVRSAIHSPLNCTNVRKDRRPNRKENYSSSSAKQNPGIHPKNLNVQQQERFSNKSTNQRPVKQYNSAVQHVWRPKPYI